MYKDFFLPELEDIHAARKDPYQIRRQGLYPSEASVIIDLADRKICRGKCVRAAYYRALDIPETDPTIPETMMKAALGKWDEIGLVNRWKEMGLWVANGTKFFDKDNFVSGELDAILRHPDDPNYKIGYEVKTFYGQMATSQICGAKGRRLKDGGFSDKQPRKIGVPKIDQFLQAVYYSHLYVTQLKLLNEFRMFYLERGDGLRVEFRVGTELGQDGKHICWWEQIPSKSWVTYEPGKVYQNYSIEDIHSRYQQLIKNLRERRLPAKDYKATYSPEDVEWYYKNKEISSTRYEDYIKSGEKIGDWGCSYCNYKTKCKKDGDTDG